MIELNVKIFGNITAKEIIGSEPTPDDTEKFLENELNLLLKNLDGLQKQQLVELKENQISLEKQMNSRPGAMAISQEKIRIFTKFSQNYVKQIDSKLGKL